MFNLLLSAPNLTLLTYGSFFLIFFLRCFLIKKARWIIMYHGLLFVGLFIFALGGGGVQNDGYSRLHEFIQLEQGGKLQDAKANPESFPDMDRLDLQQFGDSAAFKAYLQQHDYAVDRAEALFIGWLLAFGAELALFLAWCARRALGPLVRAKRAIK